MPVKGWIHGRMERTKCVEELKGKELAFLWKYKTCNESAAMYQSTQGLGGCGRGQNKSLLVLMPGINTKFRRAR